MRFRVDANGDGVGDRELANEPGLIDLDRPALPGILDDAPQVADDGPVRESRAPVRGELADEAGEPR
jgi:hypothetical protein